MVLTNQSRNATASFIQDYIGNNFTDGAIGTDGTSEDPSATALGNEVFRKGRADITDSAVSGGEASTTVSVFINSAQANGNTIKELGFFDSDSVGNLQNIENFSGIEKNSSIELFFELQIDIVVE